MAGDEVLRLIRARCDAGAAALVVTHNPRHAAWADRVVFLRDGVVVERTDYAQTPVDAPHPDAARLPLAGLGAHHGGGHERALRSSTEGPGHQPFPPPAGPRGPDGARRCAWPCGTHVPIAAQPRW